MRALDRKMIRDLLGMRGQVVAISLVIIAGVATYVSMHSVMQALQQTLDEYYRDYRFADGFASIKRAPETLADRLRAVPGVNELETRVTAPVNLQVPGFGEAVSGTLVSVPEAREPELNRLYLRHGRLVRAGREDEVLLNEVFADAHHLQPGDHLTAIVNGRRRVLTVVGIALSPEYLMQIQPGSLFPDPQRYGVLWMGRDALAAAQDMVGAFNDLSFTVAPGADPTAVIERIDRMLTPYGGQGAMPQKDQASNFFIQQEFQQLRGMATILPAIFLAVAVFLLNIVVTRLISLQREQIGVLKAFGYTNVAVGLHYLKLVLVVAVIGAVIGDALGLYFGRQMGKLYLEYYRFPYLRYGVQPGVVLADRYIYTAFARDVVRGVSPQWVRELYGFAVKPTVAFYFRTPLDVAMKRILGGRDALKYYEAGMDLGLSRSTEESFRIFQGRILDEYEGMAEEVGFQIIDATQSIEKQQQQMRAIVMEVLGTHLRNGVLRAPRGESHGVQRATAVL